MVSNAAVFITTTKKIVLGISFGRQIAKIGKKLIVCTYLAANVSRTIPKAHSTTKITASPKTTSIALCCLTITTVTI